MKTERKIIAGLIILVFMLGIVWVNAAFAFKNEPTGYRNNKWGTKVEDLTFKVTKVNSIEEIKVAAYSVTDGQEGFREMVIVLDGMLVAASAKLENLNELEALTKALLILYGKPTDRTDTSAVWKGETATIEFVPEIGLVLMGSTTGLNSLEALIEWHNANTKKQAI